MTRRLGQGRLTGKVALVTGAAHGLGRAIAEAMVAEGARVVVADRDLDAAEHVVRVHGDLGVAVRCDVTEPESVRAAVEVASSTFGGLDILVNNVGGDRASLLIDIEPERWRRAMSLNLDSAFHGIRYAAPAMIERGGGAIINVSSAAAHRPSVGLGAYAVGKAGVEALTKSAALELRPHGIRVNALVPGLFDTPAARRSRKAIEEGYGADLDALATRKQGRWGRPEEAAAAAVHLASDEASFTTGLLYLLDHGFTLT